MDTGALVVAGIMALANVGGIALLGKRYADAVDKHTEVIPRVVASLENVSASTEKTSGHLAELYKSQNDHDKRLERIETIHELRGCNDPITTKWLGEK